MGYGNKVKKWFFDEEGEEAMEFDDVEVNTEPKTSFFEQAKNTKTSEAISKFNTNKDSQLMLMEPRAYAEAQEIGKHLKNKQAVVVNLHRLQKEQAKRVVDFLTGVIFAIEGEIQTIGPKIFLCTPKNIGISGNIDISDEDVLDR